MKHIVRAVGLAVVGVMLLGTAGAAQDPEPPLKWKGSGVSSFISKDGTNDISFDIEINIDADGMVSGKAWTEDGNAPIKQLYYGEKVEFEFPELGARKIILVLIIEEDSDEPSVVIMNGRVLVDRFCYGEVLIRRLSTEDLEEALDIGNNLATPIDENALPEGLKKALSLCIPLGCFKMSGTVVPQE